MITFNSRMNNQAAGLIPLLLFMFLANYFSHQLSFAVGSAVCLVCMLLYYTLSKDKIYRFTLLPAAATLTLYALFFLSGFRLKPVLSAYSPLVTEVLLVVVLSILRSGKRIILRRIRNSQHLPYKKILLRTSLNEFFFLAQLAQTAYTIHLFIVLLYSISPPDMQDEATSRFLYRQAGIIIGILLIVYEHIRVSWMQGSLKKEMWLPVLDDKGKVIGCIARSVARSLPKKFYHPIVRILVVYNGMLYLVKRSGREYISPDTLDHPYTQYVLFRHSIEDTVKKALKDKPDAGKLSPKFLIRYTFENKQVKHLISLYVIYLKNPEQFDKFRQDGGKLWTPGQIKENLGRGVFSEYLEKEIHYLENTVFYAKAACGEEPPE